jgi:HK97 family phage major capsid protein
MKDTLRFLGALVIGLMAVLAVRAGAGVLATHAIPDLLTAAGDVGWENLSTGALGLALAGITATGNNLRAILAEMKKLQDEYKGRPMPEDVGRRFDELGREAKALQDSEDRTQLFNGLDTWSRKAVDPVIPTTGIQKQLGFGGSRGSALLGNGALEGYLSLGAAVVASPEYQSYLKAGAPQTSYATIGVDTALERGPGKRILVPVSSKMAADIRQRIEANAIDWKAVPTIGANVIEPSRIADVARTTEHDRLRLRDVLNVAPTGEGNAVEYLVITSYTRAATEVAESAAKPESTMAIDSALAPVRTIAVWMPATVQQLQDIPQLQNMIDTELLYDLDKEEEEQIMYGSGAGQEFQGILPLAGVPAITRTVTSTQNLDRIRIGVTDILIAGYEPNAVAVHPIDWEAIVLLKGTDNRYVWIVVTDPATGQSRVWGLDVVETVAMKNPANLQRYLLVGDFVRGATLWDRMQSQVIVGMINDQLIKNLRTILAEKRVAFGVKRPKAFAKYETATAV